MKVYRGLDPTLKAQVKGAVIKLSKNPNIKGLRLEPLEGMQGVWSIRANDNFRILILLGKDGDETCYVVADAGNHDIYR